jgi:hypothetical protein
VSQLVQGDVERLEMPAHEVRFTRRGLRERLAWGDTQLKVHLARLVELEYLIAHRVTPGRRFVYELAFDGAAEGVAFPGLIDPDTLRAAEADPQSGDGRASVGARSGDGRAGESDGSDHGRKGIALAAPETLATHVQQSVGEAS